MAGWLLAALCGMLAACAGTPPLPPPPAAIQARAAAIPAPAQAQTPAGGGTPAAASIAAVPEPPRETQPASRPADEAQIFFARGATTIDDAGRQKLRRHAERLKGNRRLDVTLIGHTDHLGSRSYNLAIAEQRTEAVAEVLQALGVHRGQIRRYGVGYEKAGAPCKSAECSRRQRRVELIYSE